MSWRGGFALCYVTLSLSAGCFELEIRSGKRLMRGGASYRYHARQELVKKHKARVEGNKQVDELL